MLPAFASPLARFGGASSRTPVSAPVHAALGAPRADRRDDSFAPRLSHRVVTQADRVWLVREAGTSLTPNAPRDRCLLCESAVSVRSTWEYPRDWALLPDDELLRLFR